MTTVTKVTKGSCHGRSLRAATGHWVKQFVGTNGAAIVLMGCLVLSATAAPKFSFENVWKVEIGMTKAQVEQLLGKPNQVEKRPPGVGGDEGWAWIDRGMFKNKTAVIVFTGDRVSGIPPRGEILTPGELQRKAEAGQRAAQKFEAENRLEKFKSEQAQREAEWKKRDAERDAELKTWFPQYLTLTVGTNKLLCHYGENVAYLLKNSSPVYGMFYFTFNGEKTIENLYCKIAGETKTVFYASSDPTVLKVDSKGHFAIEKTGEAWLTFGLEPNKIKTLIKILELPVSKGQTRDEVIKILGLPDKRTESITDEEWRYEKYPKMILQFDVTGRVLSCTTTPWGRLSLGNLWHPK